MFSIRPVKISQPRLHVHVTHCSADIFKAGQDGVDERLQCLLQVYKHERQKTFKRKLACGEHTEFYRLPVHLRHLRVVQFKWALSQSKEQMSGFWLTDQEWWFSWKDSSAFTFFSARRGAAQMAHFTNYSTQFCTVKTNQDGSVLINL